MRKIFCGFMLCGLGALLLASAGCSSSIYEKAENWAVADNDTPAFFSEYDLIFLYPSQEEVPEKRYMNWIVGHVGDEVRYYVRLVISAQFGKRVRVFSPFVPMLGLKEYGEILEQYKKDKGLNFYKTGLRMPIDYMIDALDVYFTYYNPDDHPFVIYGQGQGALVLYEAMKRCRHIRPSNGFVAGYFFGMPGVTNEEIDDEFGGRGIKPAANHTDTGVIIVCNTNCPGTPVEKTLAVPNGAAINPLNWRTDAVPADRKLNLGAIFFDHNERNPVLKISRKPHFCGAVVDPKNGVVNLTGIPPHTRQKIYEGNCGSDVWGIFVRNVSRNAKERVAMYKFIMQGVELPE